MQEAISNDRLLAAFERAREDLLARREPQGHWVGKLSTSALSTATAVSALALVERHDATNDTGHFANEARESLLSELIVDGINWLADHQNDDGGWGDTELSFSNIATTMLAVAAFHLTGVPVKHADALERAEKYIKKQGGIDGLKRRYGKDKTFAAPILANCAMAEMVPWGKVPALPFEMACLPQSWYRFARMPVVSYAIPALVAIGQAKFFHDKPWNPITRTIRQRSVEKSLDVLRQMQPTSGGYLEAVPLTSFVVMSLASIGRVDHPVTQLGLEFLVESVREDGSWPIDTDLATWNTTLAINALAAGGEDVSQLDCLEWLLDCQHLERHPFTGADPGGWGWSDLSGAVPDADDTPSALLALANFRDTGGCDTHTKVQLTKAARKGGEWLLNLQNSDGGWPTFCRGWGKLPFDRSGADLTAHALRAMHVWRADLDKAHVAAATDRGLQYLAAQQNADGSWFPLWFGNQDHPQEENPVYGTAKVLRCYADLGMLDAEPAQRGIQWLVRSQHADGGWGSIEETALGLEALLAAGHSAGPSPTGRGGGEGSNENRAIASATSAALACLIHRVEENRHLEPSPIGFYFAKLWYYEELYPLTFTLSALGHAVSRLVPPTKRIAAVAAESSNLK